MRAFQGMDDSSPSQATWRIVIFLSMILFNTGTLAKVDIQGPMFIQEPPDHVDFSNSTGVTLTCAARGVPLPTIRWLHSNGAPVTNVPNLRVILENGTLWFPPFPAEGYRQDIHSTAYRCIVSNTLGSIISRDTHLRAVVKQFYEVHVYDEFVIRGNTAVLRCYIPSFVRDYVIVTSWTAEGSGLSQNVIENGEKYSLFPTGELHIREVGPRDSLQYRCRTRHRLTNEIRTSSSVGRLIVTDTKSSVPPRLTHVRSSVLVQQGETTQLPCAAQGYPLPIYSWHRIKDMQMVNVVPGGRVQMFSGTLQLRNVHILDSGTYHCIVNNSVGTERSETLLTVTAPLSIQIEPRHQVVDVNQPASLHCKVSGHPSPHVTWWKDGKPLVPERRVLLASREILRIASVQREDRGMYQCFAQNAHESIQATAELKLGDVAPQITHSFTEKTIQTGVSISLKCITSGNPPPQIKWTLDDHLITSNERFLLEEHVSQHGDVISYVNITKIRSEEGGEYQCIASNKVGQASHTARINVYGPPFIRPFRNVTAVAGSSLSVRCHVTGYPINSISWERDGTILPINHRQKVFANGTLVVQNVQRASDAGIYSCLARDEQGRGAKATLHLAVLNPPKISPFSFPLDIQEGMRGIVTCSVIHGDLPISISWMKDGKMVQPNAEISVKNLEDLTSTLVVHNITPRNNGNYTCLATNGAASVTHTAQLLVLVPPRWISEPRDQTVISGQEAILHCQAEGSPSPFISWKKAVGRLPGEYTPLDRSGGRYEALANGSLALTASSKADEGYYLCQASNSVGAELSKVVYLKVHVPAYFEAESRRHMAKKGTNAVLPCEAFGDLPMTITWRPRNQRPEMATRSRFTTKEHATPRGYVSELIINKVERSDSAEFTCLASNAFGRDEIKIYLVVQEAPEAPQHVKMLSHGSRSAQLSWSPPYDGNSPIGSYLIVFRTADGFWKSSAKNVSVPGTETAAVVEGLRPATRYEFRVAARNDVGIGELSDPIRVTTEDEVPEGEPQNVTLEPMDSQTIRIQWKPPKRELCNGEILGYHIGYRQVDVSDHYLFKALTTGTEIRGQFLLSDLKRFSKYAVVVRAYNRVGAGPLSPEQVASTLEDVPSQPARDVACTSTSSQSMHVTWKAPVTHALHGILRGYKVYFRPIDETTHKKLEHRMTSSSSIELTELPKFTNHSVQVAAVTGAGDGVRSLPIYCRTDEDVPGPPADIKVLVMSSDAIIVSWRPPLFPNGFITKYTAYMQPLEAIETKIPSVHTLPSNQLYYEARGLKENHHYEFWVTASTSVGEGGKTHVVSKSPISTVPARIASFSERLTVNRKSDVKLPCRAVGIPTPDKEWSFRRSPVQVNTRTHLLSDGSLLIMNVRSMDAGNYSCRVQNIYASDEIIHELIVQVNQEDDYPPMPPTLSIVYKTMTSFVINWKISEEGLNPIQGFTLNYKKEYGDWQEVHLPPEADSYRLENLSCGTRYQLFMSASNAVGNSDPSDMVSVTTDGSVPDVPEKSLILKVNSTFVTLSPQAWPSGGCPMQALSVEYRGRNERDWTLVAPNIEPTQDVLVSGLSPGTPYSLKLTALNDAGSTVVEYDIYTLNSPGEMLNSEGSFDEGTGISLPFYRDLNFLVPFIAILIIMMVVILGACFFIHCRRGPVYKYRPKTVRTNIVSQSQSCTAHLGETKNPLTKEEMTNPKAPPSNETPPAIQSQECKDQQRDSEKPSSGDGQDDICPYATFQLPGCRYDDVPGVRFRTFGYQKNAAVMDDQSGARMSQYSKVRKKRSPQTSAPRCPPNDTFLCQDQVKSGSLRKQHQVPPRLYPSVLLPSAPPAEYQSPSSDSDTPDIAHPPGKPRLRGLHHVPDILDHRPDSSSSREVSSEDDSYSSQREKRQNDDEEETNRRYSLPQERESSTENTTTEETRVIIRQSAQQIPSKKNDDIMHSLKKENISLKKDKAVASPSGLAAVEEELIALLKRGIEQSNGHPETKTNCQIKV